MTSIKISDFSPTLFWDVDKTKIDFELHAAHIVDKVMQRGTWEDFTKIIAYYGRKRVGELVKNLRFLDKQTLQFSSVYFQIPKHEMRCFIWQQSNPTHWNY
jgi:hypothetical protein